MVSFGRAVAACAGLALILLTLFANVVAATGPVASWSFEEASGANAEDGVGMLDGAITGAGRIPDGHSGKALRFDGTDRVTIPDNALLRGAQMTVRLWVRGDPESPPADGQVILEKGDLNCAGGSYALVVDGDHVAVRYREATANGQLRTRDIGIAPMPSLWDGEWHQVSFHTRDEEWGGVGLYQQGWMWGTGSGQHAITYAGMTATRLSIGGPAGDGCSTSGFAGDIDEVSVYSRPVARDELATAEPVVDTTVEIESIEPLAVAQFGKVDVINYVNVRVSPMPLAPGRLSVWLTAEDGVERGIGAKRIQSPYDVPADGRMGIALYPEDGGEGVLEVRWEPSLPQTASDTSEDVNVAKLSSNVNTYILGTHLAGDAITINARVGGGRVNPNGIVQLWELVGSDRVLIGSKSVEAVLGSFNSAASFTVPGRTAGTYEFETRYLGGTAHLPAETAWRDTVVVHPPVVPGIVRINGGDALTQSASVLVEVPATGAVAVHLSLDPDDLGQTYPVMDWSETKHINLAYGNFGYEDGLKRVWVRWADAQGNWTDWSESNSDSIVLDRWAPNISGITAKVVEGSRPTSTVPVRVDWSGTDAGTGIASFDVGVSRNGGSWTTFGTALAQPSALRGLAPGSSYRFRVRGLDRLGNRSAWQVGPTVRVAAFQEGSTQITYRGKWTRATGRNLWNGASKYATASTASASLTFTGSTVAWVAPALPSGGSARVFVDGVLARTVNLSAAIKQNSRVVFERSWATTGSHTIRVEVVGTPGHPRVDIDGFVVLRLL